MVDWATETYIRGLGSSLASIQESLFRISSENRNVYDSFNTLNQKFNNEDKHDRDLYGIYTTFEHAISIACIDYLKNIITNRKKEVYNLYTKNEMNRKQLLVLKSSYALFNNTLKKILYAYDSEMKKIGEESEFEENDSNDLIDLSTIPKFIYNDNYVSDKLDINLLLKYPGSFYYQELCSERRTEDGDIYIDYDHQNEQLLIKYMNNDDTLVTDIRSMNYIARNKFLNDLHFFELPVKIKFIKILCSHEDIEIMKSWRKRKRVIIDGYEFDNICKELTRNGKIEEIYSNKLLKDISYNNEKQNFSVDIHMEYKNIINDFFKNGRKWNRNLLCIKEFKYEYIINEMAKFGFKLSDNEINELEQAWIEVRQFYINGSYKNSMNDCLKRQNLFVSLYLKNIDHEQLHKDGYLYINIILKCVNVIETYLNNNKQLNSQILFVPKLKYMDLLTDLETLGISLNENEKNELKNAWIRKRRIFINDDYKRSINLYLLQSDKFTSIYENFIEKEKHDEYDDCYYVNIYLTYEQVINDYITHNNILNYNLIRQNHSYRYDDFMKELNMLGIQVNTTEMRTLKEIPSSPNVPITFNTFPIVKSNNFSFMYISKIINNIQYDNSLKQWLGTDSSWKLIYKASEHGYTSQSFHEYCDDKGPTLIVIKSRNGWIFGGYTTKSWKKKNFGNSYDSKIDNDSFLFTLKNAYGVPPTRYNVIKDKGGIGCNPMWGPAFGGSISGYNGGIILQNYCFKNDSCSIINIENGYEYDAKYKNSLFVNTAGPNTKNTFAVDDYEVFCRQ